MAYNPTQTVVDFHVQCATDALEETIRAATEALDQIRDPRRSTIPDHSVTFPYHWPSERFGNYHIASVATEAERHLNTALTAFRAVLALPSDSE